MAQQYGSMWRMISPHCRTTFLAWLPGCQALPGTPKSPMRIANLQQQLRQQEPNLTFVTTANRSMIDTRLTDA